MKNVSLFGLVVLLVSFATTGNVFAAEMQDDFEQRCRAYAQEDNIPAEELDSYIADCVETLTQEGSEKKED